jgi:ABC-2 type transport system ATP-binding protein
MRLLYTRGVTGSLGDDSQTAPEPDLAQDLAIICRGLRKVYEPAGRRFRRQGGEAVVAVEGLDLSIRRGECFGLLGPNGAGKTTTVEILEGLLPPTAGEVRLLGLTWAHDQQPLRERIGVALQETRLPERLSVEEILALFTSFYPRPRPVSALLGDVQLEEKRRAWVGKLSGGQRQRLAVACALAGDPEILFLDEPTTGLDPQSRRQLWELVEAFRARGGTVLITTHYMEEAERLCDRVAIIDHGRIIRQGSPRALIAGLGAEHVIDFELEGGGATNLDEATLRGLASVTAARFAAAAGSGTWSLTASEPHKALPALVTLVHERGLALARLATRHATLEDVFVALTGRQLRDA